MSENIKLKQHIKNQECHTVTNDYLCDDCVAVVFRRFLEQEKAGLSRRTVSAYQKAILEAEYDRLLLELI